MDTATAAYIAGVLDSDGCFGIRRSTYHQRVRGDAKNPVFSERVSLKQVTPQAVDLVCDVFGGRRYLAKPQIATGRPLHTWDVTDKIAAAVAAAVLPHLRIKPRQAELLLEMRLSKTDPKFRRAAYWYGSVDRTKPLYTITEAATHHKISTDSVRQSIRNDSVPVLLRGSELLIPCDFWDAWGSEPGGRSKPPQLIAWRERLYDEIRRLNSPRGARRVRAI